MLCKLSKQLKLCVAHLVSASSIYIGTSKLAFSWGTMLRAMLVKSSQGEAVDGQKVESRVEEQHVHTHTHDTTTNNDHAAEPRRPPASGGDVTPKQSTVRHQFCYRPGISPHVLRKMYGAPRLKQSHCIADLLGLLKRSVHC
jgi:hypothetical protein